MNSNEGRWRTNGGSGSALDALRAALRHEDARVRSQAARAIGYMGPDAAEAAPDLVRMLAKGSDAREALNALREIGEAAVPHIQRLIGGDQDLNSAALEALRAIGCH